MTKTLPALEIKLLYRYYECNAIFCTPDVMVFTAMTVPWY